MLITFRANGTSLALPKPALFHVFKPDTLTDRAKFFRRRRARAIDGRGTQITKTNLRIVTATLCSIPLYAGAVRARVAQRWILRFELESRTAFHNVVARRPACGRVDRVDPHRWRGTRSDRWARGDSQMGSAFVSPETPAHRHHNSGCRGVRKQCRPVRALPDDTGGHLAVAVS